MTVVGQGPDSDDDEFGVKIAPDLPPEKISPASKARSTALRLLDW
jgi:hypothetical protein